MTATHPPIRVLPPAVAARIAAGEVIERPASVVKELVENALDAGARRIRIDVQGGGLTLIRVGDDGRGIPAEELPLAVQRHATSKLAGDDLSQVRTLGFRGEALPSIAAVAELTLASAADGRGVGRRLVLRGGRVVCDEPAPQPRGTTVTVRNLFQELPARLAAARRAQTEVAQIGQMVRRLALAAPGVRLTLVVDGRPVLRTSGSGDLATALAEVYGAALAGSLLPLGPVTLPCGRVWGFVSGPETTRPGRGQLHVIVNGRWAQPRGLLAQLETAYRPLLPRGRHPVLAAGVEVAPDRVDINIHPAKLEVRLLDEAVIGAALAGALRGALGRRPRELSEEHWSAIGGALLGAGHWPPPAVREAAAGWDESRPIVTPHLPPLRLIGQVQERLLLLEGPAGLYLVDQHRAHERILYERLRARHGGAGPEPVALPEPILLELRPAQVARFGRRLEALAALGFQCEVFGGRSFLLRTVPCLPGVTSAGSEELPTEPEPSALALAGLGVPEELAATLLALADDEAAEGEDWQERLLVDLACRTAVRRGRPLAPPALRALIAALGQTSAPAVCPHGAPLLMHVSAALLERQFGWR
jgi:DNA mismatch repair protein MutL